MISKQKKIRAAKQEFVVSISEMDKYLQPTDHELSIQLHQKRKQDLIDILIGWFEKDFDEKITYAKKRKVKHCPDCGKSYVFKHFSCPQRLVTKPGDDSL